MAGAYPDAPSRRLIYDLDGSLCFYKYDTAGGAPTYYPPSTDWVAATTAIKEGMNDRLVNTNYLYYNPGTAASVRFGVGFPFKYDLDGIYWSSTYDTGGASNYWSSYSTDTTNMVDGTWANMGAAHRTGTLVTDHWRDNIEALALTGVAGVIIREGGTDSYADWAGQRALHLYGTFASGEAPDRLLFLDADNSDVEFTRVLDYGDVARNTVTDRTIKLKNNSGSLAFNNITVYADDLQGGAAAWYEFSDDDITYDTSIVITSIAAGASSTVYVRQSIPSVQDVGVYDARIIADHASTS